MDGYRDIPFFRPSVAGAEHDYVRDAIENRRLSGPGPHSEACEALIRSRLGADNVFVVPSCTAALEMSALLLNLGPGDEVIMPSFTFVSNANAVVLRRATPVFVDVDPVTFNLDPQAVQRAANDRTRAIFVTHYAGVPADMDALQSIAGPRGIHLVEDAAQAYGSRRNGRSAGMFAPLSCFSFDGQKNVTAGEAGALVVNGAGLRDAATIIREKGTDRTRFKEGKVDFYTWQDVGSAQIASEITAAYLHARLEQAEEIIETRLRLWHRYHDGLCDLASEGLFELPAPPTCADHNGHIFFVVLPNSNLRADLANELAKQNISALTHYVPLHTSPGGQRYGRCVGSMDGTERASSRLLRLPLYHDLGSDQERVIEAIRNWAKNRGAA